MSWPKDTTRTKNALAKNDAGELSAQGKASLIASIEADAQAEIDKMLREAADQALQREQYTDKKIELMRQESRQKAAAQGDVIRSKALSQAELEIKRRRLRASNEIVQRIMSLVEQKLQRLIGTEAYREVLIRWITEAALGLGGDMLFLNASVEERRLMDETLLHLAQERIQQAQGRTITIRLADAPALASQGVILTTKDGRMAYNNQVRTRLLRQQRSIQRLIHDHLFAEER